MTPSDKMKEFIRDLWEVYSASACMDEGDVFEILFRNGIITDPIPYNPHIHGYSEIIEPGEPVYFIRPEFMADYKAANDQT